MLFCEPTPLLLPLPATGACPPTTGGCNKDGCITVDTAEVVAPPAIAVLLAVGCPNSSTIVCVCLCNFPHQPFLAFVQFLFDSSWFLCTFIAFIGMLFLIFSIIEIYNFFFFFCFHCICFNSPPLLLYTSICFPRPISLRLARSSYEADRSLCRAAVCTHAAPN